MRYFFVTDTHNRSERDNPKGRVDNFAKALLLKQEELGQIIIDNEIDVLLMGGDLFDRFDVPLGVVNDVSLIWKTYKARKIFVVGSHDYNGFQIKTLRRTGLGNLVVNGNIEIVSNGLDMFPSVIPIEYMSGDGVYSHTLITGTPHTSRLAERPQNFFTAPPLENSVIVQMIHGDVFPTSVPWAHQTLDAIHPFITADVVLCGHIHCGWPTIIRKMNEKAVTGETLYVNPGSMGRTENGPIRQIRGFLFSVDSTQNEVLNCSYLPLKSAAYYPFAIEDRGKFEGSPSTDFTSLMQMISSLQLKKVDFRQHIPNIIREAFPDEEEREQLAISERVVESLDNATV
jgi:DNA repair exonuclease SbcCD nuclease subunit